MPARRQGRRGPGRHARGDAATSWSSPTPTWRRRPTSSPLLVEALETADAAYGSRIQPDGSRHARVASRRSGGRWARRSTCSRRSGSSGPVQDTQCGFKGFRRDVARDLFARQQVTSIVFDVEVIYLARRRGYRTRSCPIRWADRRGSRMHPGPRLALRVAWDLFRIPLIHRDVRRVARGATDQPAA